MLHMLPFMDSRCRKIIIKSFSYSLHNSFVYIVIWLYFFYRHKLKAIFLTADYVIIHMVYDLNSDTALVRALSHITPYNI